MVSDIKSFTNEEYHQDVRTSALEAWKSCRPHDPKLQKVLMDNAENAQYGVKLLSLELLGSLHVTQAVPVLEKVVKESSDIDFRVAAQKALVEIQRVLDVSE